MKTKLFPLLSALALYGAAPPLQAAEFWVGAGSACQYAAIQDAIDAARATPEADTIRIAKDGAYTNQVLSIDTPVSLVGGHLACGNAERDGYTSLEGNSRRAVLAVFSDAPERIEVHLDRLDISRGGETLGSTRRGGLSIGGNVHVRLHDSVVRNNYSGGGSGINVWGARAVLTLERWVDIRENTTYGNGGGILVDGGWLKIEPHGVTIKQNRANINGKGGGIALVNGGVLTESTNPIGLPLPVEPVRIIQNSGARGGGGIYVGGVNSKLLASEILVSGNTSDDGHGGGILVENQGEAQLYGFVDPPFRGCRPKEECLRISDNTSARSGAALAVRSGGTAYVAGAIARGNALTANRGGNAFLVEGNASNLKLTSSLVADNSCSPQISKCTVMEVISADGDRNTLNVQSSTFARNGHETRQLIAIAGNGEGDMNIHVDLTLVADKDYIIDSWGNGEDYPSGWMIVTRSMRNRGPNVDDPDRLVRPIVFADPANGDYRLMPGNIAIDYGEGSDSTPAMDLDHRPRGIDDPAHPNRNNSARNIYDIGAYEFHAVYDRIFADGFETSP